MSTSITANDTVNAGELESEQSNTTFLIPEVTFFTTTPPTSTLLYMCADKSVFLLTALLKFKIPLTHSL